MRHRVFGRRLGRDIKARSALLANLATALLENGQLTTTVAKAKFARPYVEKLISSAKKDRLFTNRKLASVLSPAAFRRLVDEIAPGFGKRQGGYLRIIKAASRRGDNTTMAKLELLPWDKTLVKKREAKPKGKKLAKAKKSSVATSKAQKPKGKTVKQKDPKAAKKASNPKPKSTRLAKKDK